MTMATIRRSRKVPAKRGMSCRVDGRPGVIKSAKGGYVYVLFEGTDFTMPCHPTWRFEYIMPDGKVCPFGMER